MLIFNDFYDVFESFIPCETIHFINYDFKKCIKYFSSYGQLKVEIFGVKTTHFNIFVQQKCIK